VNCGQTEGISVNDQSSHSDWPCRMGSYKPTREHMVDAIGECDWGTG
jgi:hypothetical protein